jgi:hypothetical protein
MAGVVAVLRIIYTFLTFCLHLFWLGSFQFYALFTLFDVLFTFILAGVVAVIRFIYIHFKICVRYFDAPNPLP